MSENGENNLMQVEPQHIFSNDELIRAVYDYVLKRQIRHGDGLSFDWEITLMDGTEIPPEDIKDIKVRCYLGELP